MAEDGAHTRRKDGRQPMRLIADGRMPDGVDTAVKQMEAAASEAVLDRSSGDSARKQLSASNDSVLVPGKCRDCPIRESESLFAPNSVVNGNVARHGRRFAPAASLIARQT
jgi:hypothetical protein